MIGGVWLVRANGVSFLHSRRGFDRHAVQDGPAACPP
jgi:hypothetical protein